MFLPVLECPAADGGMRRLGGDGDGGKWLCMAERLRDKAGCVIYSIGSLGNYEFELAMLNVGVGWLRHAALIGCCSDWWLAGLCGVQQVPSLRLAHGARKRQPH